jgi:hypothetical protein
MDITKQIQSVIDALKADKSIAQPWRNYAVSDASRLLAVVEKGLKTSNLTPPPEVQSGTSEPTVDTCTCTPGGKLNVNCPVHGIN